VPFKGDQTRSPQHLDGKGVAALGIGEYVQLDLDPGEQELGLAHRDEFDFHDSYLFRLDKAVTYVKVYNTPFSTRYAVLPALPDGFLSKYRPVKLTR